MGKKLDRVYHALLDGANQGLAGAELYEYVLGKCPKTSSRRVVKASLFALSDPDVRDKTVLDTIYALAIRYRLASLGVEEDTHDDDDDVPSAPSVTKKAKTELASSAAVIGK